MNDLRIRSGNETVICPFGASADSLFSRLNFDEKTTIAVKINNEIYPIKTSITVNSAVEPVSLNSP